MSAINPSLKSIFIHVAKCGGSSLCSFKWNRGSGHATYYDFERKTKDIGEYFTWAFVRNPWSRAVSAFEDCPELHEFIPDFATYIHILYKNKDIFREKKYITYGGGINIPGLPVGRIHFWPCSLCLQNKEGILGVDFIGKLEDIDQDFKIVCRKLDIEPASLPRLNKREGKPKRKNTFYKDLYNDSLINQVGEIYQQDINLFKYSYN